MNAPQPPAAPASATDIPDFATLAADPEIAALLDFEPAVRKVQRPDGCTPELQREFIARLAHSGTPQAACKAMGKHVDGIKKCYELASADGFRAAWDAASAIGRARNHLDAAPPYRGQAPGTVRRGAAPSHWRIWEVEIIGLAAMSLRIWPCTAGSERNPAPFLRS